MLSNTQYEFWVSALNASGISPPSERAVYVTGKNILLYDSVTFIVKFRVISGCFVSSDASLLTAWEFPVFIWRAHQAICPCFRVEEPEAQRQNNIFKCNHGEELGIRLESPSSDR